VKRDQEEINVMLHQHQQQEEEEEEEEQGTCDRLLQWHETTTAASVDAKDEQRRSLRNTIDFAPRARRKLFSTTLTLTVVIITTHNSNLDRSLFRNTHLLSVK
jgi:hypothetical protein